MSQAPLSCRNAHRWSSLLPPLAPPPHDRRSIIVFHKVPFHQVISPSTPHSSATRVSEGGGKKKSGRRASCQRGGLLSRAACAFRASRRSSPGYGQTDESSAYPSRPRDGLRISSMVQRRRDPWRHRELNPRPHIRAASITQRGDPLRSAIWVLPLVSRPILTLTAGVLAGKPGCFSSFPSNLGSMNGEWSLNVRILLLRFRSGCFRSVCFLI